MVRKIQLTLMVLVLFASAACAGMRAYPTGLRADQSPVFYAHLKAVAEKRSMQYSDHNTSLNVRTERGDWLQFMTKKDVIELVVLPETKGLDDQQIATRQEELRKLGDELIAEAKSMAEESRAFDPKG